MVVNYLLSLVFLLFLGCGKSLPTRTFSIPESNNVVRISLPNLTEWKWNEKPEADSVFFTGTLGGTNDSSALRLTALRFNRQEVPDEVVRKLIAPEFGMFFSSYRNLGTRHVKHLTLKSQGKSVTFDYLVSRDRTETDVDYLFLLIAAEGESPESFLERSATVFGGLKVERPES